MWQQTLKQIDHTITPQQAASLWNADPNSVTLINDDINVVYRFKVNGQGKYLRITHAKIRSYDQLAATIDYQSYLFANKAPVCQPIKSKFNNYIEEVTQDDMSFLVHVVDEVPGEIITFDYTDKRVYVAWGKAIAKLHKAAKSYQPDSKYKFTTWQNLHKEVFDYSKTESELIKKEYQAIDAWLNTLREEPQIFGLTHGDHRDGNVLYDGKRVYIIDFDEPVYHWFTADIARPFLELYEKPFAEWQQKLDWYITGYRSILPLADEQIKAIPWFIRMKKLDIYLWTKNSYK